MIAIKPKQINTKKHFMDTPWQNSEKETVARNIVCFSKAENTWFPFSFKEYSALCSHTPGHKEEGVLESFVDEGSLVKENNRYSITNKFIAKIAEFVII